MKLRNSLIINLITVLHRNGVPAHRLENSIKKVAKKIKFNVFLNIGLNSITISIDEHDLQFVKIINFDSTNLNLSKIHEVNHLISKFCNNQLTLDEFNDKLLIIDRYEKSHSSILEIFFFGISTGSASILFGAGIYELLVSFLSGLIMGGVIKFGMHKPQVIKLMPVIVSMFAIVLSRIINMYVIDFSFQLATVTSLIILIPGFSFTVAVTELSNNYFNSGLSRFANSVIVFMMITLGVVIGNELVLNLEINNKAILINPELPNFAIGIGLFTVPAGFMFLFKANIKHFIWIFLATTLSYFSIKFGGIYFKKEILSFLAVFVLGSISNLLVRNFNLSSSLMLVPGIILLVPGALGFKSVSLILDNQVIDGIENAFSSLIICIALTSGLILSNLLVKTDKPI